MTSAEEKLSDARIYVKRHAPYFYDAVLRLIPYPSESIPTYAVTKNMVMVYNPNYVMQLTDRQNATRLWHEIQHVLRDSFGRLVGIDPDINNTCSDLAINSSGLPSGDWDFGPDGILPAHYGMPDGLTMEEYFKLLPPQAKQHVQSHGGCGSGRCGGIAGNSIDKDLEAQLEQIGRSKADITAIKRQTASNILNHAKSAGKMPGGWKEWAEALLTPSRVPWSTKLQSIYRDSYAHLEAGADEYSYARLSKRTYAVPDGAILPYMIELAVDIALVLDTSASMNKETEIKPALREARNIILQSGNDRLWLVQIDAALGCQPQRVAAVDLLKCEINGRGGTDFRPAFTFVPTLKPRPRLLIYFTDGIGPAPARPPEGMEVIWCLMGKQRRVPANWGRVVEVDG